VSDLDRLFSLRPQDERNAPLRDIFWGSFLAIFFWGFTLSRPKLLFLCCWSFVLFLSFYRASES
jgi:hypothetical protein